MLNLFLPTTPIDYDYLIDLELFDEVERMIEDAYYKKDYENACRLYDTLLDQQRVYIAKNRVWEVYL